MIILDEQRLGRNLESDIEKWYPGVVQFIVDLRPNTVIKDDAIPQLLHQQNQATFITINVRDFWLKVAIGNYFCIVCFVMPDSQAKEIPQLLRSLLQRPEFNTKAKRMGKVIRVADNKVSYYTFNNRQLKII